MKQPKFGQAVKGFTLIEFLVASVLAMIVVTAAGSTYFMTRRLGDSAQKRLFVQQNLRDATSAIMRDARMAGSFGCYNTSSTINGLLAPNFNMPNLTLSNPNLGGGTNPLQLSDAGDNTLGVHWGSVNGQDALVFIYGLTNTPILNATGLTLASTNNLTSVTLGKGDTNANALDPLRQTLQNKGNIVLSSCRAAYGINMQSAVNGDTLNFGTNLSKVNFTQTDTGELSVSQLYAAAYIHNPTTKQLMRVDLDASGKWQSPQLLAEGINSMNVSYAYADDCSFDTLDTDAGHKAETFTFTRKMKTVKDKGRMPAMVQIQLNYDLDTETENKADTKVSADYIINATVRGGNVCGNRTPLEASI